MITQCVKALLFTGLCVGSTLAQAADCGPLVSNAVNWVQSHPANYVATQLRGDFSAGRYFYLETPQLRYTATRVVGDPPRQIVLPAQLKTAVPVEMRSNFEASKMVNVRVELAANPRVVITRASDGALLESYTSVSQCTGTETIGGQSKRSSAVIQTKLVLGSLPR